jgi:hypothetical protein
MDLRASSGFEPCFVWSLRPLNQLKSSLGAATYVGQENKEMSAYRIKPGQIPKYLKVPRIPPQAPRPSGTRPPIRGSSPDEQNAVGNAQRKPWFGFHRSTGWFGVPKRRDIAREHPHARLKEPRNIRIYDLLVKGSVPGMTSIILHFPVLTLRPVLLIYFIFYAEAGEKSDIAIVRIFPFLS